MMNKDQRLYCKCGAVYEFSISAKQICAPNTTELAAKDSQQLKAEIGAIADRLQEANAMRENYHDVAGIVGELRRLSAVCGTLHAIGRESAVVKEQQ